MSDDVRMIKHKVNINKILIAIIVILVLAFSVVCYIVGFSGIYTVIKNEQGATAMNVYHVCTEKDVEKYNEIISEIGRSLNSGENDSKLSELTNKKEELAKSIKSRQNSDKDATCQYLVALVLVSNNESSDQLKEAMNNLSKLKDKGIYASNDFEQSFKLDDLIQIQKQKTVD